MRSIPYLQWVWMSHESVLVLGNAIFSFCLTLSRHYLHILKIKKLYKKKYVRINIGKYESHSFPSLLFSFSLDEPSLHIITHWCHWPSWCPVNRNDNAAHLRRFHRSWHGQGMGCLGQPTALRDDSPKANCGSLEGGCSQGNG